MGLDIVEFVMWAEKEFEIENPDKDAEKILMVGEFSKYVHRKLSDMHGSSATPEAEIFDRIKKFLVIEFRIAPDKINHGSYFVKDLRLDQ